MSKENWEGGNGESGGVEDSPEVWKEKLLKNEKVNEAIDAIVKIWDKGNQENKKYGLLTKKNERLTVNYLNNTKGPATILIEANLKNIMEVTEEISPGVDESGIIQFIVSEVNKDLISNF